MAIDLSTFDSYIDVPRYSTRIISSALNNVLQGILSNKGAPGAVVEEALTSSSFVDEQNNVGGALYWTEAFLGDAITFIAPIQSSASYVLTYYQFGPSDWAE